YFNTYVYADCPCHGFGFTVCPNCHAAQAEWDAKSKQYDKWLEERKDKVERTAFLKDPEKRNVQYIEGEFFYVSGTIRACDVMEGNKRIKMTAGERAALYIKRCDSMYRDRFYKTVNTTDHKPKAKFNVTLWSKVADCLDAAQRLAGARQAGLSTGGTVITVEDSSGDQEVYKMVIHGSGHMILYEYSDYVAGGVPDWFLEAYSHWMEYQIFGEVTMNCAAEGGAGGLTGRSLENQIKMIIKNPRMPNIMDFCNWEMSKLDPQMRLVSFGLVDWMIKGLGGKKLDLFLVVFKRTKSVAQSFRDAYGIKLTDVMEEWKKWVIENY
ncbi:MAG: hypothetical protein WC712_12955, partial [Candidatus Brocadiia bacterium]